jgi:hypothetical protein
MITCQKADRFLGRMCVPITVAVAAVTMTASDALATGRFVVSGGVVTDSWTGLFWQALGPSSGYTWSGANNYCAGLVLSGYSDWRLPSVTELNSIVDNTRISPVVDLSVFPGTESKSYWTLTTSYFITLNAFRVSFDTGSTAYVSKESNLLKVRCVR